MTAFPSWLPKPSRSYAAEVDPYLAKTEFEVGIRQRRRYGTNQETVSVNWEMSQLEFDAFKYFVEVELQNGALPFDITILGFDGLETRNALLLGGKFSSRPFGFEFYTVAASLLCSTSPVMEAAMFDFLALELVGDPFKFTTFADALHAYVESQLA